MSSSLLEPRQFMIGKYEIRAQRASGSAHMLRYTVMLNGRRLGALLSMPTESDCRFLEAPPPVPPPVPPLKIFQVTYRRGRPKKGTTRPSSPEETESGPSIPWSIKGTRAY